MKLDNLLNQRLSECGIPPTHKRAAALRRRMRQGFVVIVYHLANGVKDAWCIRFKKA
jgi:hypothetical protein